VAVVGGGVYGCVSAADLARDGHQVTLYERRRELLLGATRANQGRIHRGYHYPRSPETAAECKDNAAMFEARFADAIVRDAHHHYGVAVTGSRTTPERYRSFLAEAGLTGWRPVNTLMESAHPLDLLLLTTDETFVDVDRLRGLLWRELAICGVEVVQEVTVSERELARYDRVVHATYGRGWPEPLQWEVVEVLLARLPTHLRAFSLVVLDGPFCSVDPLPDGRHMIYDVERSVLSRNVGLEPLIPPGAGEIIDAGPFRIGWRWQEILNAASRYVPELRQVHDVESMLTVRAVLPDAEATDARPALVALRGKDLHVLPGKIASCVSAARRVVELCRG